MHRSKTLDDYFRYRKPRKSRASEIRNSQCEKICYGSHSQAKSALKQFVGSGLASRGNTLNAYECRRCGMWHLGNSSWARPKGNAA